MGLEVVGSNLLAVPEVTLDGHSLVVASAYQNLKLGPGLGLVDSEDPCNGACTLALKPMGGVNQSLKQRVPVAPQNGDIVTGKKRSLHE